LSSPRKVFKPILKTKAMEIRRATLEDTLPLAELMHRVGKSRSKSEKSASLVNSQERAILVVEDESRLLGYAIMKKRKEDHNAAGFVCVKNFSFLAGVRLDPEFENPDYRSRLVLACDSIARKWGKRGIWLNCREDAKKFYESNGYDPRGEYYLKFPMYVMAKAFYKKMGIR
jgi:hypothetical protein